MAEFDGPTGAPESGETPRPEVFEIKKRSEAPVVSVEALKDRKAAIVQNAGDATLILKKGGSLEVFDAEGERIDLPDNALDLDIADWKGMRSSLGLPASSDVMIIKTGDEIPARGDYIPVEQLDSNVQSFVSKMIDAAPPRQGDGLSVMRFPEESWKVSTEDLGKIQIDVDGEYVLIGMSGTDSFIAYKREDGGIKLEPRNWKRVDTLTAASLGISSKLEEGVYNLHYRAVTGTQHLSNGKIADVRKEGLTIRQPGVIKDFQDNLSDIGNNICEDSTNGSPNGIIFYTSESGQIMRKLDTTKKPPLQEELPIPAYHGIENLRVDATGSFITFESSGKFIVLDKGKLEAGTVDEVASIDGIFHGALDDKGKVRGLDAEGHLVVYDSNFQAIVDAIKDRRAREEAEAARVKTPAEIAAEERDALERENAPFRAARDNLIGNFHLETVTDLDEFPDIRISIAGTLANLRNSATDRQLEFYRAGLEDAVLAREETIAHDNAASRLSLLEPLAHSDALDIGTYDQGNELLDTLRTLRGRGLIHDESMLETLRNLDAEFVIKAQEFKTKQYESIRTTTATVLSELRKALHTIPSSSALVAWEDDGEVLSDLKLMLGNQRRLFTDAQGTIDPTIEAEIIRAQQQIYIAIREKSEALREKEALAGATETDVLDENIALKEIEIKNLIEHLRRRGIFDPAAIRTRSDYRVIEEGIEDLSGRDRDLLRRLKRQLGSSLALYVAEMEREQIAGTDDHGRPQVLFGETAFPIRQEEIRRRRSRTAIVDLDFVEDESVVVNGEVIHLGEIGFRERTKEGVLTGRIYQGKGERGRGLSERRYRTGTLRYKGVRVPGTKVPAEKFLDIQDNFEDWEQGDNSRIRKELAEKRKAMRDAYDKRPVQLPDGTIVELRTIRGKRERYNHLKQAHDAGEIVDTTEFATLEEEIRAMPVNDKGKLWERVTEGEAFDEWEKKYKMLTEEYGKYAVDKNILLFSRIEELRKAPDTEEQSSLGYVPEWKSDWTVDSQTAKDLEEIAKFSRMQLNTKQGLMMLQGHAGTGKDVLVRMFAHMTNRPLFVFDASRWTTERNLSQDVTLKKGDLEYLESAILQGIQTPGAIVYINEFNAMPEQAQIFLHGLLDSQRRLTLKASGGEERHAKDDVLLYGSMNPGYAGTFQPQLATWSRVDVVDVKYSPLKTAPDQFDLNRSEAFSASEALRIARGVDSLEELTYDLNLSRNEFVKEWNYYINEVQNGAGNLDATQVFDLKTIAALVQFTDKLREAFMNKFNKNPNNRHAPKISNPVTGRELSKCAYELGQIPASAKTGQGADPSETARLLLEKFFVRKLTDEEEKRKVLEDMNNPQRPWVLEPRP